MREAVLRKQRPETARCWRWMTRETLAVFGKSFKKPDIDSGGITLEKIKF